MMRTRKLTRLLSLAIPAAIGIAAVVIAVPRLGGEADRATAQEDLVVSLDMDTTDGGPCADIDSSATHARGESYDVAICVEGLEEGNAIGALNFDILYDDTLNRAPEVADSGAALDDNPDANAGTTTWGDGLGEEWDCSAYGLAYPEGDKNPASGPGNGDAFIACHSIAGSWTLGDDETSGVLALIRFEAIAEGTDTMAIASGGLYNSTMEEMGTCNPDLVYPMDCNGGEDIKSGTQPLTVSLDVDTTDGGPCRYIDSSVSHDTRDSYDVAICVEGLELDRPIGALTFDILYDDTLNRVPEVADVGAALDDNPDANAGTTTWGDGLGEEWDCSAYGLAYPEGDKNPASGPGNGDAFIPCFSSLGSWTMGDDETSGVLAVIHFEAIGPGDDTLTIANGGLYDSTATEMGTCNPDLVYPMDCAGGADSKSGEVVVDWDMDGVLDEDDNCFYAYNPDQLNTDGQRRDNGTIPGDWASNPTQDTQGNACDDDDDNDWMLDTGTHPVTGVPGEDDGCGSGPTDPLLADTDGDTVIDGAECALGSDPNDYLSRPGLASPDVDKDGLPAWLDNLLCPSDVDGDGLVGDNDPDCDSDEDVVEFNDGREFKKFGTDPAVGDTDGDTCADWAEIVDLDGNRASSISDLYTIAGYAFPGTSVGSVETALCDLDGNLMVSINDVFLAAQNSSLVRGSEAVCTTGE